MPTTLLAETAASLSALKNESMVYEVLMDEWEDTELAAIEEVCLAHAIAEGRKNKFVSEEIF